MNPLDDLDKHLNALVRQEAAMGQIMTLAVEYEAKTITAERFGDRVLDILRAYAKAKA